MDFLDTAQRLWLLFDPVSKCYMAFDGHKNMGYYSRYLHHANYQFNKLKQRYRC